jgi:predicted dienelactone hydrolase
MFELPAPTGSLPIGTTTFHLTDTRPESFGPEGARREVIVHAWYPSMAHASGAATAPYLREGLAEVEVYQRLTKQPAGAFDTLAEVRAHAVMDAPPAASGPRFSVLLLSAGYIAIPSTYHALIEDLASHGYAVLHVVHPFEATAARLSDGRTVRMVDESGAFQKPIQAVLNEWGVEGDTMATVTATTDEAEQLKLLRGYLGGLKATHAALGRWVDDTRLVLDRLASLPADSPAGRLRARLDLDRIGALGHSMGGVTAAQFCVEDRRCKAGLNLDGIPQYGTMIDQGMRQPFLMVYSGRAGRLGASDAIYRKASKYYRVDVADTNHIDFSDMILWGGPLAGRPMFGKIAPARAAEVTRTIVREYFDQELRGRPSPLLTKKTTMTGVTVR